MADVHDKKTRSYNMSRIKGKNTKPEVKISGAKCWCGDLFLMFKYIS
jgi:G:T-mismatch repair DNA endonuclease (very short patch repair protein)